MKMMNDRNHERETDSVDLFTAFAIGAMIGVGATLLLRPDQPTTGERIMKRFEPITKNAQKAARRARREYGRSLALSQKATRNLGQAGKDVLDDFRSQVEEILTDARDELTSSARQQVQSARKALGRKLHG
jgi:gas vesicle protein